MHAVQSSSDPDSLLRRLTHGKRNRPMLLPMVLLLILGTIHVQAQKSPENKKAPVEQKASPLPAGYAVKDTTITYRLIPRKDHTWGYQILLDSKVIIKQQTPPGMPGNIGFATKKAAEDVAKLVISKIKKGEMPPIVTIDEMKKLKAI